MSDSLEPQFSRHGMPTAVLNVREAAAYLAVTPKSIYRMVSEGDLTYTRVRRSLRFRVEHLDEYLDSKTTRQPKKAEPEKVNGSE